MKRLISILIVLLLPLGSALASASEARREVLYFYENYCESCTPEEDFEDYFLSLTGTPLRSCDYSAYNVAHDPGKRALEDACGRFGLVDPRIPLVIVDGIAYEGAAQMEQALASDALAWGSGTDSTIVYLYVPACADCARAVQALEALPETVTLRRGTVEIESRVIIERIDISRQPGIAEALFDAYQVPDDRRVAPSVFLPDRCLSGADEIEKNLADMVRLGWAAGSVSLPSENQTSAAVSLTTTLGAGLAAGLNTCALSMLLLFLSVVMEARKNAGALALTFLASKFACYVLIGVALTGLLQRFNPAWLQPLARGLLTVMGGALIALNVWDALQALRSDYGKIRNQLPAGLRGCLHRMIRTLSRRRFLLPAVMALGVIVALGEFLCAGQLFLMRLLSGVNTGSDLQLLHLLLYCVAFILPSAALCSLVLGGRSQVRVSAFLAEHMAAARLLTAAAMLALILTAWLL